MIRAIFRLQGDRLQSFELTGHADFGAYGEDIVCAGVTSAVQLVCNAVTEVLNLPVQPVVEENRIRLALPAECPDSAEAFLQALRLHLELIAQDYEENIQVTVLNKGG